MILFGWRDDAAGRRPGTAASFMDDEAYLSSMKDQALAQARPFIYMC